LEQVIFGGFSYGAPLPQTDTRYNVLQDGYTWTTDEYRRWQVISTDGVIKNLRLRLINAPPGNGKKYTFTLMLNGNPTALTFDIADLATSGSNMVDEVVVTGGDTVSIECVPDGTPTSSNAVWSSVFEGDNPNESLIMGRPSGSLDRNNIDFGQVMTSGTSLSDSVGAENDRRQIIPTDGIIKNFYVNLNIDPGTPPDAYRLTVRLNGATVAQSPIVKITANDKTGSDLVHELAVVAGDYITLMAEPLNTPSLWPYPAWGLTFEADIDGESIVIAGSYQGLNTSQIRYGFLSQQEGSGWDANENRRYMLGQVCTLKKLHMLITTPPGVGNHWDFTLRIGGADSSVVATIVDPNTTGDSGALEDTVALNDYVVLKTEPTDGPAAADAYWGFVCYIEPPVPTGSEDLLGKFDVGQDSAELLAKVEVQQSGSAELLGKFEAQATAELLAKAEIQQSGSADLLARLEAQSTADLLGKFEAQSTAELLGKAIIRNVGSVELLGRFEAQSTADLLGRFEAQSTAELLAKAEIQQSGSAELLCKSEVQQLGSSELLVKVEVRGLDSAELLGRATIRHAGTPVELLGRFEAQSTAELLGRFEAQSTADLLGRFEAQSTAELLGKAVIRHVGTPTEFLGRAIIRHAGTPAELLGEFVVRHEISVDLLGEFTVRQVTSENLLCELIVRHSAVVDLPGEFIVRQVTSEDLLGELIVRQEASVDLHAAFESQATVDLLVEFIVRQPATINLPGKFTVKHSAELDLPAKLQVTHSERLFAKLWIRHPSRLWTNRRYVNGVVDSPGKGNELLGNSYGENDEPLPDQRGPQTHDRGYRG